MANQGKGKTHGMPVNWSYAPRQSHLPPKSPFLSIGPTLQDYSLGPLLGQRSFQIVGRDGVRQHQRTSSESILIEEQPSWLDDLLNEPETPVKKGSHRRSASDSAAFLDLPSTTSRRESHVEDYHMYSSNVKTVTSRRVLDSECFLPDNRIPHNSYQGKPRKPPVKIWDASGSLATSYKNALNNGLENRRPTIPTSSSQLHDSEGAASSFSKREEVSDRAVHDSSTGSGVEGREPPHGKPVEADADSKRAKQQFAQRSRVRKLQYISELERNVNALQAEELEVSAEVAYLSQQRIILTWQNQALKQRIAGLAKQKMLKDAEHESLLKEAQQLKLLYRYQQLQRQSSAQSSRRHQNPTSIDYDLQQLQFSKLSLGSSIQPEPPLPSTLCSDSFAMPPSDTSCMLASDGNDYERGSKNGRSEYSGGYRGIGMGSIVIQVMCAHFDFQIWGCFTNNRVKMTESDNVTGKGWNRKQFGYHVFLHFATSKQGYIVIFVFGLCMRKMLMLCFPFLVYARLL